MLTRFLPVIMHIFLEDKDREAWEWVMGETGPAPHWCSLSVGTIRLDYVKLWLTW